jgi:hypothetical protein
MCCPELMEPGKRPGFILKHSLAGFELEEFAIGRNSSPGDPAIVPGGPLRAQDTTSMLFE